MRKTIALLLSLMMIMMFALASCGGGSEDLSDSKYVGTWRAEVTSKGAARYWDLTFTSDYKFTYKKLKADTGEEVETKTGTYSVENDIVTINADGFGTSAFQINGNELTFAEWDHGIVYKKIN